MTRVLLVGRHRLGLEGLASILRSSDDVHVTALAPSLERMPSQGGADVIVVDAAAMPTTWLDRVLAEARQRHPEAKTLVLVEDADDPAFIAGIDAGAAGCLPKTVGGEGLCQAVDNLARDAFSLGPDLTRRLLERVRGAEAASARGTLTVRECEVLREIASGATNMQVSKQLGISESTVKNHLYSIYRKLGATSRSKAVSEAFRRGIVAP